MVSGLNNVKGVLIFCTKCGGSEFDFHDFVMKKHKVSARISCQGCGHVMLVEGGTVNPDFVTDDLSMNLLKQGAKIPPPEMEEEVKPKKVPEENEYKTMSFRVTEGQQEMIRNTLDLVKEQAGWTGKIWNGAALECICADYMAGNQLAPSKIDYGKLENMQGEKLVALAVQTFSRMARRMFPDEEQMRDWIKMNMPKEYVLRKGAEEIEKPEECEEPIKEITEEPNESNNE